MAAAKKKKIRRKGQVFRVLDKLLTDDPYTAEDLAHELNIAYLTAKRYLRELWMLELIHITAWDRRYNYSVPVYKWGGGADKIRPKPYTREEIAKRYRAKHKDRLNERRREKNRLGKIAG